MRDTLSRRTVVRVGIVAVPLVWAMPAWADEPDKPDPWTGLQLFHDGKGHYLAIAPLAEVPTHDGEGKIEGRIYSRPELYVGNGVDMVQVPVRPRTVVGPPASVLLQFEDWRFPGKFDGDQDVSISGQAVRLRCGKGEMSFVPADARTRDKIAKRANLAAKVEARIPWLLARDNQGTYFFVDRHPDLDARTYDRHLYIGHRGTLKKAALEDVIVDAAGELYVSKAGALRVEIVPGPAYKALWMPTKGAPETLTMVPRGVASTKEFIYGDLGVYLGKKLGTPCDWL